MEHSNFPHDIDFAIFISEVSTNDFKEIRGTTRTELQREKLADELAIVTLGHVAYTPYGQHCTTIRWRVICHALELGDEFPDLRPLLFIEKLNKFTSDLPLYLIGQLNKKFDVRDMAEIDQKTVITPRIEYLRSIPHANWQLNLIEK